MSTSNSNVGALVRGRRNGWDVICVSPPFATHVKKAGKRPAILINGDWVELRGWATRKFTDAELAAADGDGANAGIRFQSGRYFAFDVDVNDVEIAKKLQDLLAAFDHGAFLGTIYRVGRRPKFALLFLAPTVSDLPSQIALTWDRNGIVTDHLSQQRVNLFTCAGQIVVSGIHPTTGEPYRCFVFDKAPPATWRAIDILDKKPEEVLKPITPDQIDRVMRSIVSTMRDAGWGEAKISFGTRPWTKRILHKEIRRILNDAWTFARAFIRGPAITTGTNPRRLDRQLAQRLARLEHVGFAHDRTQPQSHERPVVAAPAVPTPSMTETKDRSAPRKRPPILRNG